MHQSCILQSILISGFIFNFSLGKWLIFTSIYLRNPFFFCVYDNLMAVESNFLLVYEDSHLNFCRIIDTGFRKNSSNLCIEIEIVWTKPSKHAFTNRWNLDRGILIAPLKVDSEYNQAKSIKLSVQKSISCSSYINLESDEDCWIMERPRTF